MVPVSVICYGVQWFPTRENNDRKWGEKQIFVVKSKRWKKQILLTRKDGKTIVY